MAIADLARGADHEPAVGPRGRPAGAAQAFVLLSMNTMPILASASLVPSLPIFLKHYAHVPGAAYLAPMIITLPTLCIGLFSALAGAASDRWGRRRLILGALLLFTVCGVAPIFFEDLRLIFLARFGLGVAEACVLTSGNALMGDYFSGEVRRRWLSYSMVLGAVVGAVVLLCAGALGSLWWRAPFALYGVGALLLAGAVLTLWEPPRRAAAAVGASEAGPFPWKTAILVASVTLMTALPYFAQNTQHGRIFAGLGLTTPFKISLFATVAGLGTISGSLLFRRLPALRIEQALMLIYGIFAVAFIGLSLHPPLLIGTALDVLSQVACGLCYPAMLAWALNSFAPEHRGRGVGVWSASFYVSSFVSGLLVGLIGQYVPDFLHAIGVMGIGCAIAAGLMLLKQLRGRFARAAAVRA